jgi:riboflavin synthase
VDKPRGTFRVALIPHTLEVTVAGGYRKGTIVNLEADIVARYVARNLRR